jgi:hypothetical protein
MSVVHITYTAFPTRYIAASIYTGRSTPDQTSATGNKVVIVLGARLMRMNLMAWAVIPRWSHIRQVTVSTPAGFATFYVSWA